MAEIIPFRALRYDLRLVPDLTQVVAPPYDVISSEAQERYYARHPHNVVRLILAKDETDMAGRNRYTRAAETFADWRREGILRRDRRLCRTTCPVRRARHRGVSLRRSRHAPLRGADAVANT